MRYKYLSEIGRGYSTEEGTSGARLSVFTGTETDLKKAILDLRNKLSAPAQGNGPVAPIGYGKGVQALKQFHEAKQKQGALPTNPTIAAAEKRVAILKRQLELQGAVVDCNGKIDWGKSKRRVVYDRDLARQGLTRIRFAGGRLFQDDACTKPLDTANMATAFSGPGNAIYVMSETGNIHVGCHSVGYRHHSSLLAGANVAGAGELRATNGWLRWLSNKSGHYQPNVYHLLQLLHQLDKMNVPLDFSLSWVSAQGTKKYPTAHAFLQELRLDDQPDYELSKLLAYMQHLTAAVLAPKGWRWRNADQGEEAGVYDIQTNLLVPHKTVRQWLKSQGRLATVDIKTGWGR
jgi:hypothetical protein